VFPSTQTRAVFCSCLHRQDVAIQFYKYKPCNQQKEEEKFSVQKKRHQKEAISTKHKERQEFSSKNTQKNQGRTKFPAKKIHTHNTVPKHTISIIKNLQTHTGSTNTIHVIIT
jgi:hypothetical protein